MNEIVSLILNRAKSYEEADFLGDIFGSFRREAVSGDIPIILFGTGSAGKELYPLFKSHGINPACFCDNNSARQYELCCGIRVISPAELSRTHKDSLVVITTARHSKDIKKQLLNLGVIPQRILCINESALTRYYSRVCLSHWSYSDLLAYEDSISKAYELLADERSKQFFLAYLSLLTNGSDYASFCRFIDEFSDTKLFTGHVTESYLYFNTDLIRFNDGEILIDCGAYNGDSAIEFIKACRAQGATYDHVYSFEPDPSMFLELSKNVASYANVSTSNHGLWTHSTTLSFVNTEIEIPGSTRVIRDDGDIHFNDTKAVNSTINVVSIDEQFSDQHVSFIKMDIEGAEIEALEGAASVIRRCKPRLAISLYHKRTDIFEIPMLIHQIFPGYRFYLRQFSNALSETVLFAIS